MMMILKGQRVITPDGAGEVLHCTGDKVDVKLDSGEEQTYLSDELEDDNSAG